MAASEPKESSLPNRSGPQFGGRKRRKFDLTKKFGVKRGRLEIEAEEISKLEQGIVKFKPSQVKTFADFPLSEKTQKGLEFAKYTTPTTIQRECIGLALQGNDILAAAKTGSGKTLAFLIPMLEKLYRLGWKRSSGLGALIISPTRELVDQTFSVLNKVGRFHQLAGGVVFGGKDKKGKRKDGTKRYLKCREEEARTIHGMNIVVGTPGRLRELMDSSAEFRTENLQMLILDEADQCLELGFKNDLDAIMDWLPPSRQTLLFSATQTSAKLDLLRVNLKQPVCVSAHARAEHTTPASLQQSYVVCEQHDKLDLLWSFIRAHLKHKVLVFLATCKQVRFVYESFCKLRPGTTLLALHGAMKQTKRSETYNTFCRKQNAVLIATDVAARGLDFPAVHWVVQMDCPADSNTYIHRAGRTARYESEGAALLVLLPSEEGAVLGELTRRKIPIEKIRVNPKEATSIQRKMDTLCAEHVYLKEYAQRALMMYLKSVFKMKDKRVFDVTKIDIPRFARSLGLAQAPRVRFLKREESKQLERQKASGKTRESTGGASRPPLLGSESSEGSEDGNSDEGSNDGSDESSDSEGSGGEEGSGDKKGRAGDERGVKATVGPKIVSARSAFNFDCDDSSDDEVLRVKQKVDGEEDVGIGGLEEPMLGEGVGGPLADRSGKVITKYEAARRAQRKNIALNTRTTFNDEGEVMRDAHRTPQLVDDGLCLDKGTGGDEGGINIAEAQARLAAEDVHDKKLYREKIRQKHREKRMKEKEERRVKKREQEEETDDVADVHLAASSESEAEGSGESEGSRGHAEGSRGRAELARASTDEGGTSPDDDSQLNITLKSKVKQRKVNEDKIKDIKIKNDRLKECKVKDEKVRKNKVKETQVEGGKVKKGKVKLNKGRGGGFDSEEEGLFDTGLTLCDDESLALRLLGGN